MAKRVTCHPSPLTHGVTCQSTYLHKHGPSLLSPSINGEDRCRALLPLVLVPMTTSKCRGACSQLCLCKKGSSDRKLRLSPCIGGARFAVGDPLSRLSAPSCSGLSSCRKERMDPAASPRHFHRPLARLDPLLPLFFLKSRQQQQQTELLFKQTPRPHSLSKTCVCVNRHPRCEGPVWRTGTPTHFGPAWEEAHREPWQATALKPPTFLYSSSFLFEHFPHSFWKLCNYKAFNSRR